MIRLLLICWFCALSAIARAASIDVSTLRETLFINDQALVYLDADNRSLEKLIPLIDSAGEPVSKVLTGGYHPGFFWVKIPLQNSSGASVSVQLMLSNRLTSYLEFFIPDAHSQAHVQRLHSMIPTLQVEIPARQTATLYLKLQFGLQDNLSLKLVPSTQGDVELSRSTVRMQELLFGIILGLLLFNVALFLITWESSFILHAASAFCTFVVVYLAGGLAYYYTGADQLNRFLPVAGSLAVAGMNAFGQAYLGIQKSHPRLSRLLRIGTFNGIVGALLMLSGVDKRIVYFTDLNLLLLICTSPLLIFNFPPTRYRNMRFYLVGWLSLGASGIIWMASEYGLLPRSIYTESIFAFGMSMEMIIVSLGLADRINHLKNQLEDYNRNLEIIVDEKTRDIRSIMDYIPIGICMITSQNRIHRDYSRSFRTFFPLEDLEKRPAAELLFEHAKSTSDEKSQALSTLASTLGEDVINFETNAHVLPAEMQWSDANNRTHTLDLTWNAMQDAEGHVDRVLVTMRDVSDLRKLQAHNRAQQEELDIIKEILDVPAMKFQRFVRTARETLHLNVSQLNSGTLQAGDPEILRQLFLNTHTIKGIARSLYFKEITRVLHELEQSYAELQKLPPEQWNLGKMRSDLVAAEAQLDRYEQIAHEKLNRSLDQHRSIELPLDYAQQVYQRITQLLDSRDLKAAAADLDRLRYELHSKVFRDAHEVLAELCSSLPSLARDLGKEPPEVTLELEEYSLSEGTEDILRNVFVHILRNSIDHGIETAGERQSQGKSPRGHIRIQLRPQPTTIAIKVSDDGRGLHMARIRELGLAAGRLTPQDAQDPKKVAELIFESGLSTAQKVTEISGRGVGMDAIRQFVRDSGGDIRIVLGPRGINPAYQSFEFEIIWPAALFEPRPAMRVDRAG